MSVWNDIRKKSLGKELRKEIVPLHIVKLNGPDLITRNFSQLKYLGRIDGHSSNNFYPQGLGELYQVQEAYSMYGIEFNTGDLIIGYNDEHWNTDYYVYERKQRLIK